MLSGAVLVARVRSEKLEANLAALRLIWHWGLERKEDKS